MVVYLKGTKIGPLGFGVIANDAAADTSFVTLKYVDDLTLVEPISASQPSVMQEHLNNFEEWAEINNMKPNPKKCALMKVSFQMNNPQEPPLTISNIPFQEVQVAKILGVNISDDLRWSVHVAEILKKANGRLYMLTLLKRFDLPHDDLVTIFTGFVRPLAEYAAPVWHCGLTVNESIALERIQKRTCKIIMGRHYSSYDEALQECGLDSLSDRRDQLSLNFLKSLMESEQFSGWVPPTRSTAHGKNLRNSHRLSIPRVNTTRCRNSPMADLWNKTH